MSLLRLNQICRIAAQENMTRILQTRPIATSHEIFAAKKVSEPKKARKAAKKPARIAEKIIAEKVAENILAENVGDKVVIPQEQKDYDTYIASYKTGEYYKHDAYSFYDLEVAMLAQRQPQPKKPSPF